MSINIIAAVSQNGVIGNADNNSIPWMGRYPDDMKFFRQKTAGATIICGRHTFESFGTKPLPKRRNIVITSSEKYKDINVEVSSSLKSAIDTIVSNIQSISAIDKDDKQSILENKDNIWIIGGANIYREGLEFANEIYLTLIPERINIKAPVFFPWINPKDFVLAEYINLSDSELQVARYVRV